MEYESRRDADDAYHEMHNKRLGRDDVLKIEVGLFVRLNLRIRLTKLQSGLALLHRHPGASILVVMNAAVRLAAGNVLLDDVLLPHHVVAEATTLPVKMIAATVTTTDAIVIAPEAQTIETVR